MSIRICFLMIGGFMMYFQLLGQGIDFSCDLLSLSQETVINEPGLKRQRILNKRVKADRQLAKSFFDYQLNFNLTASRSNLNLFEADPLNNIIGPQRKTNNLFFSGGIQRSFRSGISAIASLNYNRSADNYPFDNYGESIEPYVSNNNMITRFSLAYPLLRGRGREIVTANEKMADIAIESQLENAAFNTNTAIYNTTVRYWQYLGAYQNLAIYKDNESRVSALLEITEELIKAEKKPSSDLLQIQADLKDKERQVFLASQQFYLAQQNLGRAIGWDQEKSEFLGVPKNVFPDFAQLDTSISISELISFTHKNRKDLKALYKVLEIAEVSVQLAENNIKPQLDLSAFVDYGGSTMGNGIDRFLIALSQKAGRNYQFGIGLNYVFPINNNRAEANLLDQQLLYSDQEIQIRDQIRNIEINVSIAYQNVLNSIKAVQKSKKALDYYQEVFNNEQYKFQAGLTTLLNLILFQERLTFAQLDYVRNQQQLAIAIGSMRYETGTLLTDSQGDVAEGALDLEVFYTLPKIN